MVFKVSGQLGSPRQVHSSHVPTDTISTPNAFVTKARRTVRRPTTRAPCSLGCYLARLLRATPASFNCFARSHGSRRNSFMICLSSATALAPGQQTSSTPAIHAPLLTPVSIKELIMRTPSYMRLKNGVHKKVSPLLNFWVIMVLLLWFLLSPIHVH